MFHAWRSLLDHTPNPLPHSTFLTLPFAREYPCPGRRFGRFAENDPVKMSSMEVTTVLLPSRRAVLGRLTTPTRTSPLLLRDRKWMNHNTCDCRLHRCSQRRERGKCSPIKMYHSERERIFAEHPDVRDFLVL